MKTITIKETSKRRGDCNCIGCGCYISADMLHAGEAIRIVTPHQRNGVTVCKRCASPKKPGAFTPSWYDGGNERKATIKGKTAMQVVFDCLPDNAETFPAYVLATHGTFTSKRNDGQYTTFPRLLLNQHGTRAMCETLEKKAFIVSARVQCAVYDNDGNVTAPDIDEKVLNALADIGIGVTADNDGLYTAETVYNSAKTFSWALYLLQDIMQCARDSISVKTQLAHIRKHSEGEAVWQRPERNKQ